MYEIRIFLHNKFFKTARFYFNDDDDDVMFEF